MTTTLRFPVRMIEALALAAHEAAYRERGDRYATVEEMAMHRADPLACDDMVMPAIRAALDVSSEFGRGCRVRREGEEVIEFINHWDEADVSAPAYVGTEFRTFEAPAKAELIYNLVAEAWRQGVPSVSDVRPYSENFGDDIAHDAPGQITAFIKSADYKAGDVIWLQRPDGKVGLARIVLLGAERGGDGFRRLVLYVQHATQDGRWSLVKRRTWPGFVERAYQAAAAQAEG